MHGGAADRSGLIHVGDEVIEVNGINVEGKTPGDVLSILVSYVIALLLLKFIVILCFYLVDLDYKAKFRRYHYI